MAPPAADAFSPPPKDLRVIIDTDPGVDDAFAIVMAVTAGMQIEGLTIVHGNGDCVETLGINANVCLRLAGADPSVKVYLGEQKPAVAVDVKEASHKGVDVHGEDGLGEMRPPLVPSDKVFGEQHAAEFIWERCSQNSGQITLVTIGPLTNVAMCLKAHPDLVKHVKSIVIMGGAVLEKRGNRTPAAEANFASDPQAAQAVLSAGFKNVILAPLDVTHQLSLPDLRVRLREGRREAEGELADFLCDISHFYISAYYKLQHSCVPVHDPVTIAYLLRPDLFKSVETRVDVETQGLLCTGMSIADWTGQTGRAPNCTVLVSVDAPAFNELFAACVERRDAAQASRPNKRARVQTSAETFPPIGSCKGPPSCCPSKEAKEACAVHGAAAAGAPMGAAAGAGVGAGGAGVVVRVGVGVLIVQEGRPNQVLLGQRKGSHGAGLFQLPGGHLEMGEGWEQCAIREVEEETGIVLKRCVFAGVTNDPMPKDGKHYITVMMVGAAPKDAVPELREPDKCTGWGWYDWKSLPEPLFQPIAKLGASGFTLPDAQTLLAGGFPSEGFPGDCAFMALAK